MGQSKSKTRASGSPTDSPIHKGGTGRVPAVEEIYVQKIAYKCGVSEEELEKKKEAYLSHASGDPTLGFQVSDI